MPSLRACFFGLIIPLAASAFAAAQSVSQTPPLMERQREIALALSACPASIADKAGVYVLEKSGYIKIRDSQNGFTAIVQHSLLTSQEPECHDAEATRTFIQRRLKLAELRAQGKDAAEIRSLIADAIAKGAIPSPTRPGVIYMLSRSRVRQADVNGWRRPREDRARVRDGSSVYRLLQEAGG